MITKSRDFSEKTKNPIFSKKREVGSADDVVRVLDDFGKKISCKILQHRKNGPRWTKIMSISAYVRRVE